MAEIVPNLVISDLTMPDVDGFELLQQIRGDARLEPVKVLISSASVSVKDQQMSLAAGGNGFLAKPLHLPNLFEVLQKHLEIHWVYGGELSSGPIVGEDPALPATEFLEELLQYVQEGRVKRFTQRIEDICEQIPVQADYLMPLLELAKQFELERIETLLETSLQTFFESYES